MKAKAESKAEPTMEAQGTTEEMQRRPRDLAAAAHSGDHSTAKILKLDVLRPELKIDCCSGP